MLLNLAADYDLNSLVTNKGEIWMTQLGELQERLVDMYGGPSRVHQIEDAWVVDAWGTKKAHGEKLLNLVRLLRTLHP